MCIRDRIDDLSEAQLTNYFSDLIGTHSWSAVKLDLYGLKFYTTHVLKKPWVCLLYTSDAADERSSVDLGGRRIIKKKKNSNT